MRFGMLEGTDAACFEQLLADGDPVALEEMSAFKEVAAQLALSTSWLNRRNAYRPG